MTNFTWSADALDWLSRLALVSGFVGASWRMLNDLLRRRLVREFFGGRSVRIVLPLRELTNRRVIAEADHVAAKALEAFLRDHRITVDLEYIEPNGALSFMPGNLVVICGPSMSAAIAERMARDPALAFEKEGERWQIRDRETGNKYGSIRDATGELGDTGYFARLRRSNHSEETFLSIAGIHAEGSVAVTHQLCNIRHLKRLRRTVGIAPFSAVVGGRYEGTPVSVTTSRLIAVLPHPRHRTSATDYVTIRTDA